MISPLLCPHIFFSEPPLQGANDPNAAGVLLPQTPGTAPRSLRMGNIYTQASTPPTSEDLDLAESVALVGCKSPLDPEFLSPLELSPPTEKTTTLGPGFR